MAVERVRGHIPQEEKFEKGGCRPYRWQWDVLIRDIGVYDVIPGSELSGIICLRSSRSLCTSFFPIQ